ncbi:MAG: hypothetical protein AB7O86_05810 [Porticoccaceae bacterium]
MTTELWFGDPQSYIRECIEVNHLRVAWNMGAVVKYRIDVPTFMSLYCGALPWRALVVAVEGTREYVSGQPEPIAVHPTWVYGKHKMSDLLDMVENSPGEDDSAINDPFVAPQWRPIAGQSHRVVVDGFPNLMTGPGRRLLTLLGDLQAERPECVIHLHRPDSFRGPFGHNLGATDLDINFMHRGKKVYLPNGRALNGDSIPRGYGKWLALVGYTPGEMNDPRNRLLASMKSAMWAADNFSKDIDFAVTGTNPHDPLSAPRPATVMRRVVPRAGDRLACDSCSLADSCKYYREGSVCSVPSSEGSQLARTFRTRDSGTIIDRLGDLLDINAGRLQMGLENEEEAGELDPEVTKIVGSMFEAGVKLAKLVDPKLAASSAARIGIGIINANNGAAAASVATTTPQEIMKNVVAALEAEGVSRDQITAEMVSTYLARQQEAQHQRAIETTATG